MTHPRGSNTLRRLSRTMFSSEAEQYRFIDSLLNPAEKSTAVAWMYSRPGSNPFLSTLMEKWQPEYVNIVSFDERPGSHGHSQEWQLLLSGSIIRLRVASFDSRTRGQKLYRPLRITWREIRTRLASIETSAPALQ